ncbi:MAG: acyl-ACP--UDP-N-acetylglucosamine O-acyltransferase [Alphaproteobacteria bacterium]
MGDIHPTAIVDSAAQLGKNVRLGPYAVIEGPVTLGDGCHVMSHAVVAGHTTLGPGCVVFPFASIGHAPQDVKYKGEISRLEVGNNTVFREHVTANPGTEGGGLVTRIGNNCLFLIGSHVAHDCLIGNNVILVNNATLGGHVIIEDFAILGGLSAVHQFVRIGRHAMVGGMSGVEQDVIPFGSVMGERAKLSGLNIVGLKRRGFDRETIHSLRTAYRLLFAREGTMVERLVDVQEMYGENLAVMDILRFMREQSSRGIVQPHDGHDE